MRNRLRPGTCDSAPYGLQPYTPDATSLGRGPSASTTAITARTTKKRVRASAASRVLSAMTAPAALSATVIHPRYTVSSPQIARGPFTPWASSHCPANVFSGGTNQPARSADELAAYDGGS